MDEVVQMVRDSNTYYYHQDDLQNVVAVTNSSGVVVERYDYGDYGQPSFYDGAGASRSATDIGNPYLFNGRRWDPETGLYYYRTRYLDPTAGRFASRDTLGLWGDTANLGNGQAYVGNNPWTRVDPYGQEGTAWDVVQPARELWAYGVGVANSIYAQIAGAGSLSTWGAVAETEAVAAADAACVVGEAAAELGAVGIEHGIPMADQMARGEYSPHTTKAGLVGQGFLAVTGADVHLDAIAVGHDIQHWEWTRGHLCKTGFDGFCIFPIVGGMKAFKYGAKAAELADTAGDVTKKTHKSGEQLLFDFMDSSPAPTVYLYQKLGAHGEHLKFGTTANPLTRYTSKELAGGRLSVLTSGSQKDMLSLERRIHETLPIGREEGQSIYIGVQARKGLRPPPYD